MELCILMFVLLSFSRSHSSSAPSFLPTFLRHSLPHTNYSASNPCMSASRSLIIPSLFHLEILCSSPPPPLRLSNLSSSPLLALPHPSVCVVHTWPFLLILFPLLSRSHLALHLPSPPSSSAPSSFWIKMLGFFFSSLFFEIQIL